jgi:hypothetical protein
VYSKYIMYLYIGENMCILLNGTLIIGSLLSSDVW